MLSQSIACSILGSVPISDAGAITSDISAQIASPRTDQIEAQIAYNNLLDELFEIYLETQFDGWDGGSEKGFSKDLLFLSLDLISRIAELKLPLPEMYFEADGEIAFDWIFAPERLLSISMNSRGRLAWLSVNNSRKVEDISQFSNLLPSNVVREIKTICKN